MNVMLKTNNIKGPKNLSIGMILLKGRTFIALIILLTVFSIFAPSFFTSQSLIMVAKHASLIAIMGFGMTAVIISGGIDLSVGPVLALSGMIAGGLIYEGLVLNMFGATIFFNIPFIIILVLLLGIGIGAVNGFLVTRFKVAPFIATLGMMYIARGFALIRSGGETFPNLVGKPELGNTGFELLGATTFLKLPLSIWIMIVFGLIAAYVFKKTPLGWHIFAVGGNEKAALLSGVRVKRIKMYVFMFCSFCAAVVGLIMTSQLTSAHPANGNGAEMNAIAAAVLGGTSFSGGIGTIGGTVIGAFVIGVLNDGMIMMNVSEFWQMVIKGLVIIFAVIVDQFQRDLESKLALQSRNSAH